MFPVVGMHLSIIFKRYPYRYIVILRFRDKNNELHRCHTLQIWIHVSWYCRLRRFSNYQYMITHILAFEVHILLDRSFHRFSRKSVWLASLCNAELFHLSSLLGTHLAYYPIYPVRDGSAANVDIQQCSFTDWRWPLLYAPARASFQRRKGSRLPNGGREVACVSVRFLEGA